MPQVSMQNPMMTQQQANMVGKCYIVIYTNSMNNCLHYQHAFDNLFILAKANAGNTDSKTARTTEATR